jgi:hypothetical protein
MNPAKSGTAVKVHGFGCLNPKCGKYQQLVFTGAHCDQCGNKLFKASVMACCFVLEEPREFYNELTNP